MYFIGLTGNIGMGKTTALGIFRNLGAHTINADNLVHDILKRPAMIKRLTSILGKEILTKKSSGISIDRELMADIVFDNQRKQRAVEKLIHPEVIKIAKNIKSKIFNKDHDALIVFEVPLLFEAGYRKFFDKVIVVYCTKATAMSRIMRNGLSREQALKRSRTQLPISRKKSCADFLINNNSHIDNIRIQVQNIFQELRYKK